MINMSSFGKRLKEIRERMGISQRSFAKMLGLDPAQLFRYERGERVPTEPVIKQVAEKLKVSTDYLLGLTDDPSPKSGELPDYIQKKLEECEKCEKILNSIRKLLKSK